MTSFQGVELSICICNPDLRLWLAINCRDLFHLSFQTLPTTLTYFSAVFITTRLTKTAFCPFFKVTVMNADPFHPFVSLSEKYCQTSTCCKISCFWCASFKAERLLAIVQQRAILSRWKYISSRNRTVGGQHDSRGFLLLHVSIWFLVNSSFYQK